MESGKEQSGGRVEGVGGGAGGEYSVFMWLLTSCCVGQEALGFIEYIRQIVAILGVARGN